MGLISGYLAGQNYVKRYKLGAALANLGVPCIMVATTGNVGPCTATSAADAIGLNVGTGTYSTVQNDAEGTVEGEDCMILRGLFRPPAVFGVRPSTTFLHSDEFE